MQHLQAGSLFQPSNLAKAIRSTLDPSSGGPSHLFGAAMFFPHTTIARTLAVLGFDFVMVDALHTAMNPENLVQIVQTINLASGGKTVAVVRVPSPNSDLLTYALDAGAAGIIFPFVNTPEEASLCVLKVRYPYAGGERSLAPSALIPGATDMAPPGSSHEKVADENVAIICQIESTTGLENAEAIALTPGVTSLMLGPNDLRVSLGLPSKKVGAYEAPEFMAAVNHLIDISEKHRIPLTTVAFNVSPKTDAWITKFRLLMPSADLFSIIKGQRQDLVNIRELVHDCGYEEREGEQKKKVFVNGTNGVSINGKNGSTFNGTNGVYLNGKNGISLNGTNGISH
ncbi:HpcH/HpaI aldolase/citrate lyase family protein [Ramaria rubella]|nr:HpcH/HpaI aldolase/citrate lyase family protein [Ramaria rubella]